MMIDWNEYHKEIDARLGELMKPEPGHRSRLPNAQRGQFQNRQAR
jgi:hypothetical protein